MDKKKLHWTEEASVKIAEELYKHWHLEQNTYGNEIKTEIQELNRVVFVCQDILKHPWLNLFNHIKMKLRYLKLKLW